MIIVNKEIEQLNQFPESLSRFEKNIPHGGAHNIYLIQTHDMNGNLTGEEYGKNLLTDNGLYGYNFFNGFNNITNKCIYKTKCIC